MNPARVKVEEEGACRVCGHGPASRVEAAHTWPRSLGAPRFDEPDLICPLCRTCHTKFDAHALDLLPFLTLDEQCALVRAAGGIERARARAVGAEK